MVNMLYEVDRNVNTMMFFIFPTNSVDAEV